MLWCEDRHAGIVILPGNFQRPSAEKVSAENCGIPTARRRSTGKRNLGRRRPSTRRDPARLGAMGYKFQFITMAAFHSLRQLLDVTELDQALRDAKHMSAFVELQQKEFAARREGFTSVRATRREVGTGLTLRRTHHRKCQRRARLTPPRDARAEDGEMSSSS